LGGVKRSAYPPPVTITVILNATGAAEKCAGLFFGLTNPATILAQKEVVASATAGRCGR